MHRPGADVIDPELHFPPSPGRYKKQYLLCDCEDRGGNSYILCLCDFSFREVCYAGPPPAVAGCAPSSNKHSQRLRGFSSCYLAMLRDQPPPQDVRRPPELRPYSRPFPNPEKDLSGNFTPRRDPSSQPFPLRPPLWVRRAQLAHTLAPASGAAGCSSSPYC